jgi:predicted TIM-barrel fold metal-dependent hydrolase
MGAIDSDAHVIETMATFDYIDPEYRHLRPRIVRQVEGEHARSNEGGVQKEYWILDGRLQPKEHNIGSNTSEESREMRNIRARLKHMDELDIDIQVLYPTVFLRAWTQDPTVETAICRSYNRWLADIYNQAEGRLRWVLMPPLRSMDETRKEIAFGKDHGACGIFVRGLEAEMRLTNPYFFRLYEMAQDFELPICFHSGNNSFAVRDIYATEGGFGRSKLPVIAAFHNLIMDGIPAKFPKLRWGFIEVSAQWLPYAFNDMALRLERRKQELPSDPLKANNMYVACQCTDDLEYVLKDGGSHNLVIGTDYGHADTSSQIEALRLLKANGKLAPAVIDRILDDNARALYGFGARA